MALDQYAAGGSITILCSVAGAGKPPRFGRLIAAVATLTEPRAAHAVNEESMRVSADEDDFLAFRGASSAAGGWRVKQSISQLCTE